MEKRLQQRLIGAAVIIALAVIFLPMLFNGGGDNRQVSMQMKIPPEPNYSFKGAAQPPAVSRTAPLTPSEVKPTASLPVQSTPPPPAPTVTQSPAASQPAASVVSPTAPKPATSTVRGPKPTISTAVEPKPAPTASTPKPTTSAALAPKATPSTVPTPKPQAPARNAAATGGKPGTPAWAVQVASMANIPAANALRDRLRKDGLAAYVVRFDDTARHTVYYRVRVGPIESLATVKAQQKKINKAFKVKSLVVPYQ